MLVGSQLPFYSRGRNLQPVRIFDGVSLVKDGVDCSVNTLAILDVYSVLGVYCDYEMPLGRNFDVLNVP